MAKLLKKAVPSLIALLVSAFVLIFFFRVGFHNDAPMQTKFGRLAYGLFRWFNALYAVITLLKALRNFGSSSDNSAKVMKSAATLSVLYLIQRVILASTMHGVFSIKLLTGPTVQSAFYICILTLVYSFIYSSISKRASAEDEEE